MKVLIAEDDIVSQIALSSMLQNDHQCSVANDGIQAIELFREAENTSEPFDIVLLDITMPNKDGIEVMKEIRSINANTKIYITSTCVEFDTINSSIEDEGANGYLIKPVTPEKLEEIFQSK